MSLPGRGGSNEIPTQISCCGRENIIRRGEDEINFPTVKRDNVDIKIPNLNQNSIIFLDIGPIPYLGLDLINPNSSFSYFQPQTGKTQQITCPYHRKEGGVLGSDILSLQLISLQGSGTGARKR